MFRPKVTSVHVLAWVLIAAAAMLVSACNGGVEEAQVKQYFRASGLRDQQTLANFAVVSFDPTKEGQVTSLSVVSVSEPKVEPLKIKELAKALAEAQAADKEFNDKKRAYQDAHAEALKRVLAAEAANKKVGGADAAVQAEWTKWRDDTGVSVKKVSDARTQLANARPIAELSLTVYNAPPPDVTTLDGQMESKDVTVDATVKMPDASSSQKRLVVTMQRAVVKTAQADKNGKWIVTAVKPA